MAIDIVASAGVFDAAAEADVMAGVYQALLAAIDATDDERAFTNEEIDEGPAPAP